jgi:cobalamin biosynthesis protein CobT
VAHVRTHDINDVCATLEELDTTSKRCNVCKKYLSMLSKTAKTYSGHPCQRRLRRHMFVAIEREKNANAAISSAKTKEEKIAGIKLLAEAKQNVVFARAAMSGSEDPETLRAVAALGDKVQIVASTSGTVDEEEDNGSSGEQSGSSDEDEGNNEEQSGSKQHDEPQVDDGEQSDSDDEGNGQQQTPGRRQSLNF